MQDRSALTLACRSAPLPGSSRSPQSGDSDARTRFLFMICSWATICVLATCLSRQAFAEAMPRVQRNGAVAQLTVDSKPWIALAGEVHNSTASSVSYMAPVWDRLAALNLNTVILPAYWELIEPEEGRFDFSLLDEHIRQARKHELRVILLWFGTIKNGKSTYAPAWVREDQRRFTRAMMRPSSLPFAKGELPISMFNDAAATADSRAFANLLGHLAETDEQHTVIAVQVENETGVLGDSRDRSPAAEKAWKAQVPTAFMTHLARNKGDLAPTLKALWARNGYRTSGTWSQVFGDDWQADEVFMAWGVSRFIEKVAAAGKERLPLPMYANAWIGPQKPEESAGAYPSGGPVPRVFDVWRAGAPSLDWLSPDIYVDDFAGWATAYSKPDQPLLVPEARFVVGNLFDAVGRFHAAGFSPFGIEDGVAGNQIGQAYGLLRGMVPLLANAQARDSVTGFALRPGEVHQATLGNYVVTVRGQREAVSKMLLDMGISIPVAVAESRPQNVGEHASEPSDPRPTGLILQLDAEQFLVVGKDLALSFAAKTDPGREVELARVEEGTYVNNEWAAGRILNGDQRLRVVPTDSFGMVKIRLLRPRP